MNIKKLEFQDLGTENLRYIRRIETRFVEDGSFEYFGGKVDTPDKLFRIFKRIGESDREKGIVLFLNHDGLPIGYDLWLGSIDFVSIDPRRVIMLASMLGATKIAIAHNHPSGACEPSNNDSAFCFQVSQVCSILGWELVDFMIIVSNGYYSFREKQNPALSDAGSFFSIII